MVTVRQVAEAVARLCGRPGLAPRSIEARPGDVRALRADTRFARETLAFAAEVSLEEGLRRYIDWFRAAHPDPAALLEDDIRNWRLPTHTGDQLWFPKPAETYG
jgi:UDP-glucose 4-epimerase